MFHARRKCAVCVTACAGFETRMRGIFAGGTSSLVTRSVIRGVSTAGGAMRGGRLLTPLVFVAPTRNASKKHARRTSAERIGTRRNLQSETAANLNTTARNIPARHASPTSAN